MTDPRLITDEELAALRRLQEKLYLGTVLDAILARNPEPWSPSEDDITAYCEARAMNPHSKTCQWDANSVLINARRRGWDAVPRRVDGGAGEG